MRKQILLVETDEQVRIAVESALRQDGFEVVSVDSSSRAEGILSVSSFDAALLGAGILDENGLYAITWLGSEDRSQTPFAVLCQQDVMIPELPEELIIRCPFPPEIIQDKVRELLGEPAPVADVAQPLPAGGDPALFGGKDVGEDFLDQALGLDQLEVNESETMNAGDTTQVGQKPASESLVGYEADVTNISSTQHSITNTGEISIELAKKAMNDSQKGAPPAKEVELVTDHGQAATPSPPQATPPAQPAVNAPAPPQSQEEHDYNWFISEMQGGPPQGKGAPVLPTPKAAADPAPQKQAPVRQSAEEFTKMVKKDISTDKPVARAKAKKPRAAAKKEAPVVHQSVEESVFDWPDTPEEGAGSSVAEVFSKEMAQAVAKEVADKLLKQLNSDKFTKLVDSEIKKYLKKHS